MHINQLKVSILVFSGKAWKGVGSLGIGFVISIILARLLSPEEFDVFAIKWCLL